MRISDWSSDVVLFRSRAYAPRLCARGWRLPDLGSGARGHVTWGRAAAPRRRGDRGAGRRDERAQRQAAARRGASAVRLAGDRPGHAGGPRRIGARAARQGVVVGKRVSVRVDLGGGRHIQKKNKTIMITT